MGYIGNNEMMQKGRESKWYSVVMIIAIVQLLAYIVGFTLVIRFVTTGEGYFAATISVWTKIALMWAVTITGMLWEKDVINHYFLGKEFFWEDIGNLIAIITHNVYFVVLYMGFSKQEIMLVMLFAYVTYLFNFVQWVILGVKSYLRRKRLKVA
ncbi:MAG: 2-vinyl bacteriochlorophyllide hydratase [Myxococcota bacterium]|jgi:3-vinyl bacteriochlorophyllide hydratase|nr:2-vinyl bacteriochlorophyllide hydratase [Myxococcota bacterium]